MKICFSAVRWDFDKEERFLFLVFVLFLDSLCFAFFNNEKERKKVKHKREKKTSQNKEND